MSVRIGEHDQRTERDCENDDKCNAKYQDFGIDKVYSHSGFSTESLQNDIAIIRYVFLIFKNSFLHFS